MCGETIGRDSVQNPRGLKTQNKEGFKIIFGAHVSEWNVIRMDVLICNLPSCHMSPNPNIGKAPWRATVTGIQKTVCMEQLEEDGRHPTR